MTPAEAREIDRLEFEAEAAALRQRAYALMQPRPSKPAHTSQVAKGGRPAQTYTVDGITLTLKEHANRCGVHIITVRHRLKNGWPIERALTPPKWRPKNAVH